MDNTRTDSTSRQLSTLDLRSSSSRRSDTRHHISVLQPTRRSRDVCEHHGANRTHDTRRTARCSRTQGTTAVARTGAPVDVARWPPRVHALLPAVCWDDRKQQSAQPYWEGGVRPDRLKCSYCNTLSHREDHCRILHPEFVAPGWLPQRALQHTTLLEDQAKAFGNGRGSSGAGARLPNGSPPASQ